MKLIPTSIQPVTITLYQGVPFDNNYEEHSLFSNKFTFKAYLNSTEVSVGRNKEAFLDINDGEYYFPRTTKTGTYNFAFGNGIVTSVIMELTGNEINSNYMKVVSGTDTYYYFITGITQKNETTYLLNLELDVVMTYTDEFLDAIEDKPVMIERKHCRRIQRTKFKITSPVVTNINPVCFNQESTFSSLKSNIIKEMTPLEFKDFITGVVNYNELMSELNWIYIIIGKGEETQPYYTTYEENGIYYPYCVLCLPTKTIRIPNVNGASSMQISADIELYQLVGSPNVQKIIISPFPPFKLCSNITMTESSNIITMNIINGTWSSSTYSFFSGTNSSGSEIYAYARDTSGLMYQGFFIIKSGFGGAFEYVTQEDYFNTTIPTTINTRDTGEYKLQIAPFKDLRLSSYYGGENRIPTQYLFLESDYDIKVYSVVSTNPETNSYYDFAEVTGYSISAKRGISNSVAYTLPSGTDAELLYNQTSKNQYENSKIINAITNGLKIVGGGLAVALAPSSMAKVAGGLAVASGVTGEIQTFTDYNAKMEDLANTPNSYNFSGSSYPYDVALSKSDNQGSSTMLPYLITYGVTKLEEDMAGEFIYNYGYEYNAESYFNKQITNGNDTIFNRKLFNYVKIREDITSKLVSPNLPINVAKKFNEILNAGIKFWTFFAEFSSIGGDYDLYFQKTYYCNAELCEDTMPQPEE